MLRWFSESNQLHSSVCRCLKGLEPFVQTVPRVSRLKCTMPLWQVESLVKDVVRFAAAAGLSFAFPPAGFWLIHPQA